MNIKLFGIALAMLSGIVFHSPATSTPIFPTKLSIFKNGGIRTVVQGYHSIEIQQKTAQWFSIDIYNQENSLVLSTSSSLLNTTIKTDNWSPGVYHIKTQAKGERTSQDFVIQLN